MAQQNTPEKKRATFVGLKEFRQNVSKYAKQAQTGESQVIVTNHNKPLFAVLPLKEEVYSDKFIVDMEEAKADVAAGRVHTLEEVKADLGL